MPALRASLLLVLATIASAYRVVIDLNTYNGNDLEFAAAGNLRCDGTWAVTVNSPGTSDDQWSRAIAGIGGAEVMSEDEPGQYSQCQKIRAYAGGRLDHAFAYHETQVEGGTTCTNDEINTYAANCGTSVLTLTRAYWPGSPWKSAVQAVLPNPNIYGIVMEFHPQDVGQRQEWDFVNEILDAGKSPFFLLPFTPGPAGEVMRNFINFMRSKTSRFNDDRVHIVIARYDQPLIDIEGPTDSIKAALDVALSMKAGAVDFTSTNTTMTAVKRV